MTRKIPLLAAGPLFFMALFATAAHADQPKPWQIGFQSAVSPSADHIMWLHNAILLPLITGIVVLVMVLLLVVMAKFNARRNPEPRIFAHNTALEMAWTILPALALLVVLIPSWRLIYYTDRTVKPELTLKVTGYQWYWGYEYPDQGVSFLSNRIPDKEIDKSKGQVRMLSVDNPVYLPVDTNVQILITGSDVIHGFYVPSFGVQMDGMPGRINETWVRVTKPGVYYGECTQLCGTNHAYMPIEVHAVSKADFAKWIAQQKQAASNDNNDTPTKVAAQ